MIRLANLNDLKAIISIYQEAKVRMKAAQIKQWEGDYLIKSYLKKIFWESFIRFCERSFSGGSNGRF